MEPKRSSDIDLATLAIAAAAAAVATYVTSEVWAGGTLVTAAVTPVIVALVKEALNRPVDRVQTRRIERRTAEHPIAARSRWWKVGLASGLAAFALVIALFTLPELVTGRSIGRGGDHATTFFGGKERKPAKRKRADEPAVGGKAKPAETASPSPTPSPTPSPSPSPSPTPSPSPAASAPPSPTP
jgi:hypothetical protein